MTARDAVRDHAPLAATVAALAAVAAVAVLLPTDPPPHTVHSPRAVLVDTSPGPGACTYRPTPAGLLLPDRGCTPGGIDPTLTTSVLCAPGWTTATVRPPSSALRAPRARAETAYGATTAGEYDHLIPLELGGANDTANLWPEPGPIPNPKDQVENALHRAVCAGHLTLAEAQTRIARDWTTASRGLP